jgi:hypothetical protein
MSDPDFGHRAAQTMSDYASGKKGCGILPAAFFSE